MELAQLALRRLGNQHGEYADAKIHLFGWNSVKRAPLDRKGNPLPYSDVVVDFNKSTVLKLRECSITEYYDDPAAVAHIESLIPLEIIARD